MKRRGQLAVHFKKRGDEVRWGRISALKWGDVLPSECEVHVHFKLGGHCKLYQVRLARLGLVTLLEAVGRTVPLNNGVNLRHIVICRRNEISGRWTSTVFPVGRRWGHDHSPTELLRLREKLRREAVRQCVTKRKKRSRRRTRFLERKTFSSWVSPKPAHNPVSVRL